MFKQYCFMFWAWFYAYKNRYSTFIQNGKGKKVRQYTNWRDLWCIAMMETAKMTTEAFTKHNNPFNFTEGSWMSGMLNGTYSGESSNMASFKSMRLGVKAWFMWMDRNGFFKGEKDEGIAGGQNERYYFYVLKDLVHFMADNKFFTADEGTYYQASLAYQEQSKGLTSPRTWVIIFAVIMALLIMLLIHWIVKGRKKRKAMSRLRRMKRAKSKKQPTWKT